MRGLWNFIVPENKDKKDHSDSFRNVVEISEKKNNKCIKKIFVSGVFVKQNANPELNISISIFTKQHVTQLLYTRICVCAQFI